MHASIWHFTGDPNDLTRRYDGLAAELPAALMRLHLCLRAPDGIVIVDTCPDRETYVAFATDDAFRTARRRHGLPEPTSVQDFPVHAALAGGMAVA